MWQKPALTTAPNLLQIFRPLELIRGVRLRAEVFNGRTNQR